MQGIVFKSDGTSRVIIRDDVGATVEVPFDLIQSFAFEQTELTKKLYDPDAVHFNMLAGKMAKISMAQCAHTHGEDMVERWDRFEKSES
jgi:hypothetical protein